MNNYLNFNTQKQVAFEYRNASKGFIGDTSKMLAPAGDCGQDVIDCFQDVYTNHGWASVAAALTTAFIPQTAVVFAAGCVGKNC